MTAVRTALLAFAAILLFAFIAKSSSHSKLILEVVTRHFTVGRQIRSIYLRVYSDGSSECHTFKFTGDEKEQVKRKKLTAGELQILQAALYDRKMLDVNNQNYAPMGPVVDSWMEWDIKIPHGWQAQKIGVKVADFDLNIEAFDITPKSDRKKFQHYPPALLKLGCLIWRIRNDVYGDEIFQGKPLYLTDGCVNS